MQRAFKHQRQVLYTSTKCKKPDPNSKVFMDLLSDLQQDMVSVSDVKDNNRGSELKEHLAMVGEGMGVFQWLIWDGKPTDYVGEVTGGAQMYGNRILKAYKEGYVTLKCEYMNEANVTQRSIPRQVCQHLHRPPQSSAVLHQKALSLRRNLEQQWRRRRARSLPRSRP